LQQLLESFHDLASGRFDYASILDFGAVKGSAPGAKELSARGLR
jgi:hypothetical protein